MKKPAFDTRISGGFTLVEITVVVFIIGIIVTFATLSIGQHSDRYIEDEAKRLHQLIRLAAEEAIFRGQEMSLLVSSYGYSFAILQGPKWEIIADDRMFRAREFPDTINVKMTVDGQEVDLSSKDKPAQVYLLSSGELTPPFTLMLSGESEVNYQITGSFNGEISYLQPQNKDYAGG